MSLLRPSWESRTAPIPGLNEDATYVCRMSATNGCSHQITSNRPHYLKRPARCPDCDAPMNVAKEGHR